ncbi:MAG: hypothetical protein NTY53_26210 [Kiritimatiellaeota bacterium]|nr:hypothetical protein [Kiritimatiellota bacterium]
MSRLRGTAEQAAGYQHQPQEDGGEDEPFQQGGRPELRADKMLFLDGFKSNVSGEEWRGQQRGEAEDGGDAGPYQPAGQYVLLVAYLAGTIQLTSGEAVGLSTGYL